MTDVASSPNPLRTDRNPVDHISNEQLGSVFRQHVRALLEAENPADIQTPGLPASLAEKLRIWVADTATDEALILATGWEPEALAALHRDRDR